MISELTRDACPELGLTVSGPPNASLSLRSLKRQSTDASVDLDLLDACMEDREAMYKLVGSCSADGATDPIINQLLHSVEKARLLVQHVLVGSLHTLCTSALGGGMDNSSLEIL